jgi:hypothetical protein
MNDVVLSGSWARSHWRSPTRPCRNPAGSDRDPGSRVTGLHRFPGRLARNHRDHSALFGSSGGEALQRAWLLRQVAA